MAEIKDKVVTTESLKALHEYNKETYETKENVKTSLDAKFDKPVNNIVPIANGGTNASNGATGLKNLFASGATVLSSYQYGNTLPAAGTVGRIFFKKILGTLTIAINKVETSNGIGWDLYINDNKVKSISISSGTDGGTFTYENVASAYIKVTENQLGSALVNGVEVWNSDTAVGTTYTLPTSGSVTIESTCFDQ